MEDHKTYFTSIEALPVIETRPSESRRDKFSWTSTQQLYEDWIENWWLSELFSWLVSAVCIGTIGVVLLRVNGQPTGSQPIDSATLTPNSIISVLSGVAKAALLLPTAEAVGQLKWSWFFRNSRKLHDFETFDMASRGPWGSIRLLSKIKERYVIHIGQVCSMSRF